MRSRRLYSNPILIGMLCLAALLPAWSGLVLCVDLPSIGDVTCTEAVAACCEQEGVHLKSPASQEHEHACFDIAIELDHTLFSDGDTRPIHMSDCVVEMLLEPVLPARPSGPTRLLVDRSVSSGDTLSWFRTLIRLNC